MTTNGLPFGAIVGQETLKRALLAVGVADGLDGLLIRGEKGTAKSTAVRALAEELPEQDHVAGCPYGCPPADPVRQCESCRDTDEHEVDQRKVPLVTLPLGATRDRVAGTLSVADALGGEATFEPGLLALANRGMLYVDEVNLLDDHLVDLLLDAAASGVNRVERDGVSVEHPAEFTLIGTMNPEEGDLRPQLRDRFALQATVTGSQSVDERVTIIDRALADRTDTDSSPDTDRAESQPLTTRISDAVDRLQVVDLPTSFKTDIAELCLDAGVEGHRADIAIARAARTLAALDGRTKVIDGDVREAATLALPHRLQSRPFDDAPETDDLLNDHFDDQTESGQSTEPERQSDEDDDPADSDADGSDGEDAGRGGAPGDGSDVDDPPIDAGAEPTGDTSDRVDSQDPADGDDEGEGDEATPLLPGQQRAAVGEIAEPPVDDLDLTADTSGGGSRAAVSASPRGRGARVRTEPATCEDAIDAPASVRAAATNGRTQVEPADLRSAVKRGTARSLVVFVVDASASMRSAMAEAKGTVMSLLEDAYQQRDAVAFVAVAGESAEVRLPPTTSLTLAARHLKTLPTGDRTPLPSGLDAARRLVSQTDSESTLVVVVTDGRATVADGSPTQETRSAAQRLATTETPVVVVDAGDDGTGVTDILVSETDGRCISLSALSAARIDDAVGSL
jgi:magnesium chelatase subunit D